MTQRVLKTTLLGEAATFQVQRETALSYVGRWLTGPLAEREASPCKQAFHGKLAVGDEASPRASKPAAPQGAAAVAADLVQRYGARTAARYARVRADKTSGPLQEHWQAVQAAITPEGEKETQA